MRAVFSSSFLCLLLIGCATVPGDFHRVWTRANPPPQDLPAPRGFRITPWEAYRKVGALDTSVRTHLWHIYADSDCYYFLDVLTAPKTSKRFVYDEGILIHKDDGAIVHRAVLH